MTDSNSGNTPKKIIPRKTSMAIPFRPSPSEQGTKFTVEIDMFDHLSRALEGESAARKWLIDNMREIRKNHPDVKYSVLLREISLAFVIDSKYLEGYKLDKDAESQDIKLKCKFHKPNGDIAHAPFNIPKTLAYAINKLNELEKTGRTLEDEVIDLQQEYRDKIHADGGKSEYPLAYFVRRDMLMDVIDEDLFDLD
ncbi:hypothetical protein VCHA53O466_40132 [Vibrio chagasii]|nr:hypothetical protein VCHA53O466_40132 [Vibrio chagasii]